jgi:Glutathione S-transferase, N-terminal domain
MFLRGSWLRRVARRQSSGIVLFTQLPPVLGTCRNTKYGVMIKSPLSLPLGFAPSHEREVKMAEIPTLFVCHGDDGGPRVHPCRRVQEALRANGIEYDKVIAAHGSPIPFLRKGSRDELREATGSTKLPALKLPDGTVLTHSRAILSWIEQQK